MGEVTGGIVRAVLASLGGILSAKGWMDDATWQQVSGALATIVTIGWSIWVKVKPSA